jgi:hypothetical protein
MPEHFKDRQMDAVHELNREREMASQAQEEVNYMLLGRQQQQKRNEERHKAISVCCQRSPLWSSFNGVCSLVSVSAKITGCPTLHRLSRFAQNAGRTF